MKKNKYIISYSIKLILTLAVLGAVIWYAQIMPINTPLVSAFNFDLAQFGIIIGLVIICLVYIFILVGFLAAAIVAFRFIAIMQRAMWGLCRIKFVIDGVQFSTAKQE